MVDDRGTGPAQRPGQDATPADAQFPYAATHGLRPSTATPPGMGRQRPDQPARRRGLLVVMAMVAALLALALMAIDLTWGPRPVFGPRSDAAASRVARGYLEALAAGDTAKALEYGLHAPADSSLLTDRMLAELRAATPISGITVSAPTGPGKVPVSYRLGAEQVTTVFQLALDGNAWRLSQVAAPIDLSGFVVPVSVNGTEPLTAQPGLFPGRYRLTTSNPRYTVSDSEFEIQHPFEEPVIHGSLELSEAGRAEVIEAAEAHLADCLSRQELEPPQCGFAVVHPEQTPLDEATVEWSTHEAGDFSDLAVSLDHAGSASADISLTIHGDVHGLDGSRWMAHAHLTRMRADLTGPVIRAQFG